VSVRNLSRTAVSLGLLLLSGALGAEEKPARVPWTKIEAWVSAGEKAPPTATEIATQPSPEPKKTATTTPKPPSPEVTEPKKPESPIVRTTDRTKPPEAWTKRYREITGIMGKRLVSTTQPIQLFNINYLMEKYGQASGHLTSMTKGRMYKQQIDNGWIAGRMWETALLMGSDRKEWLDRYYSEWVKKETQRIETLEEWRAKSSRKRFSQRKKYYAECKNIAELIKQKEKEGESDPNALWEMCQRFYPNGTPHVPIVHLRFLYKLREWYPDFKHVKNGDVQEQIAHALADQQDGGNDYLRLSMYRAATEEFDKLIAEYPDADIARARYHAGRYWMYYGDQLRHKDRKKAREAWQTSLKHFYKLQKDFPKHPYNKTSESGYNKVRSAISDVKSYERLGAGR